MTRIIVAAIAPACLVVGARVDAASECAPAAVVEGPRSITDAVTADLERRGIATARFATCPVIHARIEERARRLLVTVVDTDGRTAERSANGTAAAATIIESWARADVVAPLLAPRSETRPAVFAAVPTGVGLPVPAPVAVASEAATRRNATLSLTVSEETSVATDGSLWFGVGAGACLPIGPTCAGVLARVSADAGLTGESQDKQTGRLASDVLVGVGLPIWRGRLLLLPGVAAGLGWMRTRALASSIGGDQIDVDSGGLRASISLRASINLTANLALDFGLEGDVAPLAHTTPYDAQVTVLAGEPGGYLRSSVGVRIGVP